MVHKTIIRMNQHWRKLAQHQHAGSIAQIDPRQFPDLVPQVIIVGRAARGRYPIRLSGALVSDLHGGNLRGQNFLNLWRRDDHSAIQSALELSACGLESIVLRVRACVENSPYALSMEVFLAPVVGAEGRVDRFIGLYQPLQRTALLMGQDIGRLDLHGLEALGPSTDPHDEFNPLQTEPAPTSSQRSRV